MYFVITEDSRKDFMKPVDAGCSHGSQSPVSESKAAEGKPLGWWLFLSMCYLLRKEGTYAILHCLYWVCVSVSAKKHQEWKSFSLKGHVKVTGKGKESSDSVSKKSGRSFRKYVFCQYRMPSQGPWSHFSLFFFLLLNFLKTVIFIPWSLIFSLLLSFGSSN